MAGIRYKIKNRKRMMVSLSIIAVVMLFLGNWLNNWLQRNYFYPIKYYDIIINQASKYDIDPLLVLSVIKAESNFDEQVVSSKEAIGLMQLQLKTAQWCAEKMGFQGEVTRNTLFDPETNITLGIWYMSYLEDYYNDIQLALIAYNAGIGNVDKWLENEDLSDGVNLLSIPFNETKGYVENINTYYKWYKKIYK